MWYVSALIAVAVISYASYRWYERWSKVFLAGGINLERGKEYEFYFLATFASQGNALHCANATQYPGLNSKVQPTPNNKSWAVHWTVVAPAYGPKIRALQSKLESAASSHQGKLLVASATLYSPQSASANG